MSVRSGIYVGDGRGDVWGGVGGGVACVRGDRHARGGSCVVCVKEE